MTRRAAARSVLALALAGLAVFSLGFEWEGRLARLRRELSSPDPAHRREVVQLLGSYSPVEVRDALLGALDDPDGGVRSEAARAAGRVRLAEATPLLLDWLDDPDADVRATAARALGRIGDPRAVPGVVRVLGDGQVDVRRAGVAALASIGGDAVIVPLLGRLDDLDARVRLETATWLGRLSDPRAVVPLVGRARDDAPEVRTAVHAALGELGDARALAALVQALRDDAAEPRLAAIAALGRLGSEDAVRPLVELVGAPEPEGRSARAALAALGQIPGAEARRALVAALAQPRARPTAAQVVLERIRRGVLRGGSEADETVRALADALDEAEELGHTTQLAHSLLEASAHRSIASATPSLLSALRDGRGEAPPVLRALGAAATPEALLPLLERLGSDEARVRAAVLEGLRRYFERSPPDGRAADPLLSALGAVSPPERAPLVQLLGTLGAPRALPVLRPLVRHADPALRRAAIRAIGDLGDAEGASTLLPLLSDPDARTRHEAARALGSSASPAMAHDVLRALAAREPTDRHAHLVALAIALPRLARHDALPAPLAEQAQRALLELSEGADEALGARALGVLLAWRPTEAAPALIDAFERSRSARALEIVRVLGELDDPNARALLRGCLEASSVPLAAQAASVFGERASAEDATFLLARAPSLAWPASAAAAFSLARMARRGVLDTASAHPVLCQLAERRDPFVRANVATAMAALGAPACRDGVSPERWLEPPHAAVVRGAAARWTHAAATAGHLPADQARQALTACAADPVAPDVAAVCAQPELPPLGARADVHAFGPAGSPSWSHRWVGLRLADGSVWITRTDANGLLLLHDAPHGALRLEDPSATPLEP